MPDFIPRSDGQCLAWSAAYAQAVAADPARFNVSPDEADLLVSTQSAYAAALAVAQAPTTRTPAAVANKNGERLAMEAVVRRTACVVRGVLVDDRATLTALGLVIGRGRSASRPRIGPPKSMPFVTVRQVQGSTVSIVLGNTDAPSRRGLARGIAGATLFSFVGDVPPASIGQWRMHSMTSRIDATVSFGTDNPPGTKVWICARWINPRSQAGPPSTPVYAHLGYAAMNSERVAAEAATA